MSRWADDFHRKLNERSMQERSDDHERSLAAHDEAAALAWDAERTPDAGHLTGIFPVRPLPAAPAASAAVQLSTEPEESR
jgi:hypothetical protein